MGLNVGFGRLKKAIQNLEERVDVVETSPSGGGGEGGTGIPTYAEGMLPASATPGKVVTTIEGFIYVGQADGTWKRPSIDVIYVTSLPNQQQAKLDTLYVYNNSLWRWNGGMGFDLVGAGAEKVMELIAGHTTILDHESRIDALEAAPSGGGGVSIDDVTPSTTTTYSSSKIDQKIAAIPTGGGTSEHKGSLLLSGLSGSYVGTPANKLNLTNSRFCIEFWMKPEGANASKYILGKGTNFGVIYGYVANTVELFGIDANWRPGSQIAIPQDGNWHHIAYSYDSIAGTLKGFLDGTQVVNVTGKTVTAALSGTLFIGSASASAGHFSGKLAEVRYWNIARSSADITANYNKKLSNPASLTGLLLYYRFNVPGCPLIEDLSANPELATLYNGGFSESSPF